MGAPQGMWQSKTQLCYVITLPTVVVFVLRLGNTYNEAIRVKSRIKKNYKEFIKY